MSGLLSIRPSLPGDELKASSSETEVFPVHLNLSQTLCTVFWFVTVSPRGPFVYV